MDFVTQWFANPDWWFSSTHKYDAQIVETFGHLLENSDFPKSSGTVDDLMMRILIHDQLARHYARVRGLSPDWVRNQTSKALVYAHQLLRHPDFDDLNPEYKAFTLLPFRHTRYIENVVFCLEMITQFNKQRPHPIYRRFYMATLTTLCEINDSTHTVDSFETPKTSLVCRLINMILSFLAIDLICGFWVLILSLFQRFGFRNHAIYARVRRHLQSYGSRNVIVSLSGGVDSMVVLNACLLMRQNRELDQVWAVHINYGNRWRSRWESEFVSAYCRVHRVRLLTRKIVEMRRPHGQHHELYDRSFYETTTQNIRFRTYHQCMKLMGQTKHVESFTCPVLLGHNHDDQLENIFTNIKKQQHWSDLTGMTIVSKQKDIVLIRPLLELTKPEIFACAKESGFAHTKNSTPAWCDRGRLRLQMLPFLRKFDTQTLPGLVAMAQHLTEMHAIVDATYAKWEAEATRSEGVLINLEYRPYPPSAYMSVLVKLCHANGFVVPKHRALNAAYQIFSRVAEVELPLSLHLKIRRHQNRIMIISR